MSSITELDLTVPRSCWPCHRRKVKCDRVQPCSTCSRTGAECTYPNLDQRKKSRRVPVNALLTRLAQLEKKVTTLSRPSETESSQQADLKSSSPGQQAEESSHGSNTRPSIEDGTPGYLFNVDGESRYFGDSFIASLAHDVNELTPGSEYELLKADKNLRAEASSHDNHSSFPTIPQHLVLDPGSGWRALRLWQIYLSSIDPLVKIMHVPTTQTKLYSTMQDPGMASDTQNMLLNVVCFAAMISLDEKQSMVVFNVEGAFLIQKYRSEVEKYVAKLSLMTAPNIEYLQALTIFITTLRSVDNTRAVWIWSGLAMRAAQSLGIHMDGAAFNLSPFDCEIRRRLWWHIFLLEVRAAEDHGLLVSDCTSKKHPPLLPSNINDADIWPGMVERPIASTGNTDMTLTIIKVQLANNYLRLALHPLGDTTGDAVLTAVTDCQQDLQTSYQTIHDQWFQTLEQQQALYYTPAKQLYEASTLKASFLILFRAYQSPLLNEHQRGIVRTNTVIRAIDVILGMRDMIVETDMKRFQWFSRSNPQWFAIGFLLQQLYRGYIKDPTIKSRAQAAIEKEFSLELSTSPYHGKGAIWIALRLLKDKAFAGHATPSTTFGSEEVNSGVSSFTEYQSPDLFDVEALDSMFDIDYFDFSAMPPADLAMFDASASNNFMDFGLIT